MPDEDVSLRDSIEQAMESTPPEPVSEPAPEPTPEAPPPTEPVAEPAPAPDKPATGRDAQGRFLPQDDKARAKVDIPQFVPPKPDAAKPIEAAKPEPVVDKGPRAPQSWRPEIREKWAGLPPEVKGEVMRREAQVEQALRESSDAREVAEQFLQTVAPYEAFIRAENSDPFRAMQLLFDTAVALRTAPPASKAQLVANMVKQYAVDVGMLDNALAGQGPAPDPNAQHLQQMIQRELTPIKQFMGSFQQQAQQRRQATQAEVMSEIETFAADPTHEYYDDVAETMADLLEAAARRNQVMDLNTAYERACMTHPEVSKIVIGRRMAEQAKAEQARANSARVAGSSLPSAPAPVSAPDISELGLRDAIAASMDALSGR